MATIPAIVLRPLYQRTAFCTFQTAMDAYRRGDDPAGLSVLQLKILCSKFKAVVDENEGRPFNHPRYSELVAWREALARYERELADRGVEPEYP